MFVERNSLINGGKPRKPIYDVGINDAPYVTQYRDSQNKIMRCPYYSVWTSMLERCFSSRFQASRPNYVGCTLEESWKVFSTFKEWMKTQDWEGKCLDKDLIAWDSKHYGPDTCLFIPVALNNLLTLRNNHRGVHPIGVSTITVKGYNYFTAACSFYGKQQRLGYFKTAEEAAEVYKTAKLQYIKELAKKEQNPKIKQALLNLF